MAIFVVLATITGVVIVALTTSSGDSFEDAGRSDVGDAGTSSGFAEGARRPNEIRDPALESMGLRGVIQDLPPELAGDWNGKESQNIGFRPYCPPWEYLTKGPNEKGEYEYDPTAADEANIGGPDGAGGVYSSKSGCFAPCYWYLNASFFTGDRRNGGHYMSTGSSLSYFDDNRPPVKYQVRLGVTYRRRSVADMPAGTARPSRFNNYPPLVGHPQLAKGTGLEWIIGNRDGKPYIATKTGRGAALGPGLLYETGMSLTPTQLAVGVPTIFIPNFYSHRTPQDSPEYWEDENWEYRADPINRTCSIVNVTRDDEIVCSSEWDNCGGPS